MKLKAVLRFALLIAFISSFPLWAAAQTGYESGHQALQLWDSQAFANAPTWVRYWIWFMAASFVTGLLFVRQHSIARWVVAGFIAGLIISTVVAPAVGIIGLSGFVALVHLICWTPALYLLLSRRPFIGSRSPFALWSGLITAVILFSFIFDIRDAVIYLGHIFN